MESRPDLSLERSRLLAGAGLHATHGFSVDAQSPHPTRATYPDMNRAGAATDPTSLSAYHSRFLQASLPLDNNGTSYSYLSGMYSSNFHAQSNSPFRVPPTGIIMRQFWPPTPPPDSYNRYGIGSNLYTMFPPLVPSTDPNPYSSQGYISRLGQSPAHYGSLLEAAHKEPTYLPPGLALASSLTMPSHVGHPAPVPSLTPTLDRHPGYSHLSLGIDVGRRPLLVEEEEFQRVERGVEDFERILKHETSNVSCHHNADRTRLACSVMESPVRAAEKHLDSSVSLVLREKFTESRNKHREEKHRERKQQRPEFETHHLDGRLTNGSLQQARGTKPNKPRSVTTKGEADKTHKEKKCAQCSANLADNMEIIDNPHCVAKTDKVKGTNNQEPEVNPACVSQKTTSSSSVTTAVATSSGTVATTTVTFSEQYQTPSLALSNTSPILGCNNNNAALSLCHLTTLPQVTASLSLPSSVPAENFRTSQAQDKPKVTDLLRKGQSCIPQTVDSQNNPCHKSDRLNLQNNRIVGATDLTDQSCEAVYKVHPKACEDKNSLSSSLTTLKNPSSKVHTSLTTSEVSKNGYPAEPLSWECSVNSDSLRNNSSPLCEVTSHHKNHTTPAPLLPTEVHIKQERIDVENCCSISNACNTFVYPHWQGLSMPRNDMVEENHGVINLSVPRQVLKQEPLDIALPCQLSSESIPKIRPSTEKVQSNFISSSSDADRPKSGEKSQQSVASVRFQLKNNPDAASAFSLVTTTCMTPSHPPACCTAQSVLSSQTGMSSQKIVSISKRSETSVVTTTAASVPSHHTAFPTSFHPSVTATLASSPNGVTPSVLSSCQPSSATLTFPSTGKTGINTSPNRLLAVSSMSCERSNNTAPEKENFFLGPKELSSEPTIQHPAAVNLNNSTTCILSQGVNPTVTHWEQDSVLPTPLPQQWVTPSQVMGPTVWLSQNMYNTTPAQQPPPPAAVPYPIDSSHVPIPPGGYQVYRDPLTNQIFLLPTANVEIVDQSGIWTGYSGPPSGTTVQQVFATQPEQAPFQPKLMQEEDQLKHETKQNQNISLFNNCIPAGKISEDEETDESSQNVYQDECGTDKRGSTVTPQPLGSSSSVPYPTFPQPSLQALSYFYEASTIVHLTQTQSTTAIQTEPGKRSQGTSPMNPVTPSPPLLSNSEQDVRASVYDEGEDSGDNDEEMETDAGQCGSEVEINNQTLSVTAAIQVDMDAQTNSDDTDGDEHAVEVTDSANQTESVMMGVVKDCSTSGEEESSDIPQPSASIPIENVCTTNSNDFESLSNDKQTLGDVEVLEVPSAPVLSAESQPVMDFIDHHGLNLLVDSIEEFASREQQENTPEMRKVLSESSSEESSKHCSESMMENGKDSDFISPAVDAAYLQSKPLSNNIDPSCTDGLGLLCALAEQRFFEETLCSQLPETGLNLSLNRDEESMKQVYSPDSKSPSQVYAFSSKSSSPFYVLNSPVHLDNVPETMDATELEMKQQLAELQKKYRLKQKELAKLQPKREKEELETILVKRRPGRPRKKPLMIQQQSTLKPSLVIFGDSSSESIPEMLAPSSSPPLHPSTSSLVHVSETSTESPKSLRKKKKHSITRNGSSLKRNQIVKKIKQQRLSAKSFSCKLITKKKPNIRVNKSTLKLQVEKKLETLTYCQTDKFQPPSTQPTEEVILSSCSVPKTDDNLQILDCSISDDTITGPLKCKNKPEIKTDNSESDKQGVKSSCIKEESSKTKKNQNKKSNENKKSTSFTSLQMSLSSNLTTTENASETVECATEGSDLNLLAQFPTRMRSSATPERSMKKKLEQGESESNTSDAEISSAKKRKPGRPKKHSPSKPEEATETIVPKQPKNLAFLKAKVQAKAETKRLTNDINKEKNCSEAESKTHSLEEDIWFRRRSERIFLHDAGVIPGAISPWQGEKVDPLVMNDNDLLITETKQLQPEPQTKSGDPPKSSKIIFKHEETSLPKKKRKTRKNLVSSSKNVKTKTKGAKKQQTKEKLVTDELFAALKKCRLSESYQGWATSSQPVDQENAESSEGENLPLSALIEKKPNSVIRSCILQPEDLNDQLRVLTMDNGLFYAGTIKAIRAPDVYGITRDRERGNRSHIYSREEILNEAIAEVKPVSLNNLPPGQRICAFWSQQYRCMYPGTVAKSLSPNHDKEQDMVYVEFDDGDSGRIPLKDICMLPPHYPIVSADFNPLMIVGKRRQHRLSGESITDNSISMPTLRRPKTKTKKNKNKYKSGKKKSSSSQSQNVDEPSSLSDVFHSEALCSDSKVSSFSNTLNQESSLHTTRTTNAENSKKKITEFTSEKDKEKSSQKKKSKKNKSECKSKIKSRLKANESHHIGSSSEASMCGPPSLKIKKHKKHKDDHKHRHRHHHHHCHRHHHHKKHKHEKRSNLGSPEHIQSLSSSSSDATASKATTSSVAEDTGVSTQENLQMALQFETLIKEKDSSTDDKNKLLMVKIRTNSPSFPEEEKKESSKEAEPELSSSSSINSSGSSNKSNNNDTDEKTYVKDKSHHKKRKASRPSTDTNISCQKKRRKNHLSPVEKSKIAAFLPAQQLWRWAGKSSHRIIAKGKAKKVFYKAITRGKETIKIGDCAVFLSTGRPHLPFIGQIKTMWQSWVGNMVVKVRWFYHPEETKGENQLLDPKGALFQSPHMDENDLQTISHKCELLSWTEYKARKVAETSHENSHYGSMFDNNDIYYLAGSYDPLTSVLSLEEGVS
ncbi:LOW QUALITY PROTEIN: uncharacterized protein LOC143224975 [Tachypleus tridentatus]|uniref:LOW QUALITY PROTEIN: uncharacterized protein LOC143224975 n=1 Tax=Tachypleus tridentatus TaxID=6853 RepID=UPI003FD2B1E4